MDDVLEYYRLESDLQDLEKNANTLDSTLRNRKNELEKAKEIIASIKGEVKDFRELSDASKIWVETSSRISIQRDQVNQKEADFRMMNSDVEGRDLKQVEEELLESNRKKDEYQGRFYFLLFIEKQLRNSNKPFPALFTLHYFRVKM